MELKDTVNLILSEDFKERLKGEYYETLIRYLKLEQYLLEVASNPVVGRDPVLVGMLSDQRDAMYKYLEALRKRCKYHNIPIDKVFD